MPGAASQSRLLAALLASVFAAGLASAEPPAPPAAPALNAAAPTQEQIAAWVKALDADEFLDRETAMLQLVEAGPSVLPALRPVLTGGTLEATSRAFFVVRQMGLMPNEEAQEQAAELLSDLASRDEAPALARRAASALAELTQQRSAQALAELEALGAKVNRSLDDVGALPGDPILSLELNDTFQGAEEDLRRLKWIIDAPIVILCGQKVTDGWVAKAAQMSTIKELHLYQAAISEQGLSPLAEHPSLRSLGVY
jgi:hypothetical protein